jgi:methionyl-tRNA formyltransferase
MRLIIMGQQAFGKDCLEAVLEKGKDEIVAVYCAPDKEGKPVDLIKEFALEQGLLAFLLFLAGLVFGVLLFVHLTTVITKLADQNVRLAQRIAILESKLEDVVQVDRMPAPD